VAYSFDVLRVVLDPLTRHRINVTPEAAVMVTVSPTINERKLVNAVSGHDDALVLTADPDVELPAPLLPASRNKTGDRVDVTTLPRLRIENLPDERLTFFKTALVGNQRDHLIAM
jgi:hypothetical protein